MKTFVNILGHIAGFLFGAGIGVQFIEGHNETSAWMVMGSIILLFVIATYHATRPRSPVD